MRTTNPHPEALRVCRAIFELASADLRPTVDLLGRLLGLDSTMVEAHLARLRSMRMLRDDRLNLTMVGLAVATGLPEIDLGAGAAQATPAPQHCAA